MMGTNNLFPVIYEMADLTTLDTPRRVGLIGIPAYNQRRQFLKQVVNIGLFISIGPTLFEACKKEDSISTFTVTNCIFPDWTKVTDEESETNIIKVILNKYIDVDSIAEAISFSPTVDFTASPYYKTESDSQAKRTKTIIIHGADGLLRKVYLKKDTSYTLTIKATLKSSTGELLDGNKDGTAGNDYTREFITTQGTNPPLTVASCTLPDWSNITTDQNDKNQILILFSEKVALDSARNVISFSPAVDFVAYPITESYEDYNANLATGIHISGKMGEWYRIFFTPGQTYTLTVKGTVKTNAGKYLEHSDTSSPGHDYTKKFTVPSNYNAFPQLSINDPSKTGNYNAPDTWYKQFTVYFNDLMDENSVRNAISISPSIGFSLTITSKDNYTSVIIAGPSGKTDQLVMTEGNTYTIRIAATAKSLHNQYLDGNKDGVGGDDFVYAYTAPSDFDNPLCSLNLCTSNTCSCQNNTPCPSYSCTCVGYDCSCMYAACPGNIY
jgi:hypothetical protein